MKVRFLLDENLSPRLKIALLRLAPTIDVVRVGDAGAPVLGTPDPELLRYLEIAQRMLVTSNRTSMPGHLEAHRAAGGHLWGLLWVRPGVPSGRLAQELHLIWEASEAEEWMGRLDWIPF
ncbi:MAG: DUF5615 family PIN-like protein [Ardenticatenaceae bacterium]|nr:DUF5615 family PIN-like protein [Ardenticatenaceae bacterium]HBY93858.1 hypothetical protein [Chloroflexota bacterium]